MWLSLIRSFKMTGTVDQWCSSRRFGHSKMTGPVAQWCSSLYIARSEMIVTVVHWCIVVLSISQWLPCLLVLWRLLFSIVALLNIY